MFDRFLKESPALQLYGKLPLAKDYLRVGASKGTARALREWLDGAFSSMAARAGAPSVPWPARFVIGAVPDEPLMGSVWPSSDSGGERVFPFAMFVERRRKALIAAVTDGLDGLRGIWSQLESCYARRVGFADGEAFLAAMRGQEIALREPTPARAQRVRWETWTAALWPDEGSDGLSQLLTSLHRLASEGSRGPIRLPLVGDLPIVPQVHCWWTALVTMRLCGASDLPTVVFPQDVVDDDEAAFCAFFRGPLRVDDAPWVSSARGLANLGRGDYCLGRPRRALDTEPPPEHGPDLADTMRGVAASARARA